MATRGQQRNLRVVLELQGEGEGIVASVKEADDSLKRLENTTERTGRTTARTTRATREYSKELNTTAVISRNATRALRAMGLAIGALELTNLVRNIVQVSGSFSQMEAALKLATGTTAAAKDEMRFVAEEANRLGTDVLEAGGAFAQFASSTRDTAIAGEETREIFTAVSEAAAVLGLSADDTSGIFRAMTQIISGGTVQLQELNQISERLPGTFKIAANAIGGSTQDLRDMTREARLAAEDFLPDFADAIREHVADGVEDASNRAGGSFQRLANEMSLLGASIGQSGLVQGIATVAAVIAEATKMLREFLVEIGILDDILATSLPSSVEETELAIAALRARLRELQDAADPVGEMIDRLIPSETEEEIQFVTREIDRLTRHLQTLERTLGGAGAGGAGGGVNERLEELAKIYRESVQTLSIYNQQAREEAAAWGDVSVALDEVLRKEYEASQQKIEFRDLVTSMSAGFRSLNEDWSDLLSEILNGTAQMIVQFQSLGELTTNWRSNLSNIAGAVGFTAGGIGLGRQIGGSTGGFLGGVASGGIAGYALGNLPGAVAGSVIGGLLGLFGGGGDQRDPRTRIFLRTTTPAERPFSLEPRGDFRVGGTAAFGGFRFSGESEIGGDVIANLRQVAVVIGQLDDAIGANLQPDRIDAIARALEGFEEAGRIGEGLPVEEAFRARFTAIFGAIDEELGQFFEGVTGAASIQELAAVAAAINNVIGTDGVFADVEGVMAGINTVMEDFAMRGETLPEVLARLNAELDLLAAVGIEIADPTTGLARLATDFVDALGGLDAARDAVSRFNQIFGQTPSALRETAAALQEDVTMAFEQIGLTLDPTTASLDEFNEAFLAVRDQLGPDELADWITAGIALGDLTTVLANLARVAGDTSDSVDDVSDSIDDIVDVPEPPPPPGLTTEQQEEIRRGMEEALSQAEAQLQVMEEELALRRSLTDAVRENLDVAGAWALRQESVTDAVRRTVEALIDASVDFDGSVASFERLADASASFQSAAVAALAAIDDALGTVEGTVRRTAESLRFEGLTEEQQYESLRAQAEALASTLPDLADPDEVAEVVTEINRLATAALDIYDPARRAEVRDEFADWLDSVGDIADEQLTGLQDQVLGQAEEFETRVVPVLEESFNGFSDSVEVMRTSVESLRGALEQFDDSIDQGLTAAQVQNTAADKNLQAANTPVKAVVTQPVINEA